MSETVKLWELVKKDLVNKVDKDSWSRYLKPIVPVELDMLGKKLSLGVVNDFFALWLENNYKSIIQDSLMTVYPEKLDVSFIGGYEADIKEEEEEETRGRDVNVSLTEQRRQMSATGTFRINKNLNLRPDFTFDNFVIGGHNKISFAAAKAVAQNPGSCYNPFFVYGDVGLGKTHLLQAIANEVSQVHVNPKIEYLTSEEFVNLFVEAMQSKKLPEFRKRFRNCDLLLIDDVQFFQGKVGCTEEFFHTFNTLYNAHSQIVLAADRTPHDIGLEDRMVSRFDWGLSAEILSPDIMTRVAILKKKQENQNTIIPDDVLFMVAERISSNLRTLESALTVLTMNVSALGTAMTVELAEQLLKDKFDSDPVKNISIDNIQKEVADQFDIKIADIIGKKRPQNIALARMIAMYLSRELTSLSYPVIGEAFNRNHATILHAYESISKRIEDDPVFSSRVEMVRKKING